MFVKKADGKDDWIACEDVPITHMKLQRKEHRAKFAFLQDDKGGEL